MNWYKTAQNISPDLSPYAQEIGEWDIGDALDIAKTDDDVRFILSAQKIGYDEIRFADGTSVVVFGNPLQIIEMDNSGYYSEEDASSWIYGLDEYNIAIKLGVSDVDNSAEFWAGVPEQGYTLYHGTSKEYLNDIMIDGLAASNKTRGISNRSMGSAVFMSPDPDTAQYSYEVVIEIDVSAMKRGGYMPEAGGETPLEESELRTSLAHKIGLSDFYDEGDSSDGLDAGTVVFYGDIPARYLRVV